MLNFSTDEILAVLDTARTLKAKRKTEWRLGRVMDGGWALTT